MTDPLSKDIPLRVQQRLDELAQPRPMRRGSLSERFMKCSKAGCACAADPDARHGPYFSITRGVKGSTRSRLVTAQQAQVARRQIEAGQEFRQRVESYWEACEQWADAQLEATGAASQEAVKRGGSREPSMPRSSGRLKR